MTGSNMYPKTRNVPNHEALNATSNNIPFFYFYF